MNSGSFVFTYSAEKLGNKVVLQELTLDVVVCPSHIPVEHAHPYSTHGCVHTCVLINISDISIWNEACFLYSLYFSVIHF